MAMAGLLSPLVNSLMIMVVASLTHKRPFMLLFLLFFLFFSLFNESYVDGYPDSDALALLDFKNNLTRVSGALASWNTSSRSTVCSSWEGVNCTTLNNSQQRVSSLWLRGKHLSGPIASGTLGKLDALDTLNLGKNLLSGGWPQDFSNLSSLRNLSLKKNNFSGPLPSNFSRWPLLSKLYLSYNRFNDSIPASMGSLSHLKSLYLENNSLSGPIPPLDIASLLNFDVANNELNGSIPASLSRFSASNFEGNVNLCGSPLGGCNSKPRKLSTRAIVGIVCGALALFLLLLCLPSIYLLCRRKKGQGTGSGGDAATAASGEPKGERSAASTMGIKEAEGSNKLVFIDNKKLFDLEDLLSASAEVLGNGTLGPAFKAVLEDGLIVAVKRLRDVGENMKDEYRQRIELIGSLMHENLLPLRAYYLDKDENLLVYDYVRNGSLSAVLHDSEATTLHQDSETSFRICGDWCGWAILQLLAMASTSRLRSSPTSEMWWRT